MRSPYDVEVPTLKQDGEPVKINWTVAALIALLVFFVFRSEFKFPNIDNIIPDTVVVDPVNPDDKKDDTKPVTPTSLEGSYVVSVYETTAEKMPTWMVILQDDVAFWDTWIHDNKMQRFRFSPVANKEQAQSFIDAAAKSKIEPPFWIHAKNGKVISVHPYTDKTTTEEIKRILTKGK